MKSKYRWQWSTWPGPWWVEAEKREMALQMRAALLFVKIKMMQYELFHPTEADLQEVAL